MFKFRRPLMLMDTLAVTNKVIIRWIISHSYYRPRGQTNWRQLPATMFSIVTRSQFPFRSILNEPIYKIGNVLINIQQINYDSCLNTAKLKSIESNESVVSVYLITNVCIFIKYSTNWFACKEHQMNWNKWRWFAFDVIKFHMW